MAHPYYKQHWIDIDVERQQAYDRILAFHPGLEPLIQPLNLAPGLKILDVGSGPGYTTMEMARRLRPSGLVVGVDLNADFVAAASRRAHSNSLEICYVQSEFPPLPFREGAFDRVFCKNVLEYVDSAAGTVKEMARVAAAGGTVMAIDSDWDMLALALPERARERSERVLAAAKSIAVKEPKIGRMLYSLFRNAGLKDVRLEIFAGADTVGRAVPMLKASIAALCVRFRPNRQGRSGAMAKRHRRRDCRGAISNGSAAIRCSRKT